MDNKLKQTKKEELLNTFLYRFSSKDFDINKKISDDDFEFILEAGRLSPSSLGIEPWQFLIIQNPQIREKIKDISFGAKGQMPTASHIVAIMVRRDTQYNSSYVNYIAKDIRKLSQERLDRIATMYKSFQEDDIKVLQNERTLIDWASKQTYIALANMMTAAAHIGIDSCAIEGFNYDKARLILKEDGILDENYDISVIVAFGYRTSPPKYKKTRRPLNEVTKWVK